MPFLWIICHWVVYSIQLPASYQHGRYMIPTLTLAIGYSVIGFFFIQEKLAKYFAGRIFYKTAWGSAILLVVIFEIMGSTQFSTDVKIIDTEMVQTALWIRDHTPADTVVAAHDIGAIGFFGGRRMVDLGGVTDLDALDLLSGRTSLPDYLRKKHADLLMTFYDFYPGYLEVCTPLNIDKDPSEDGGIMLVVDWRHDCSW
jgi:hypothetical protein